MGTPDGNHFPLKRLILCIDDDAQVLQMLRDLLTGFGYSVLVAQTAESALKMFLNNDVDAVMTDYALERLKGRVMIQSLRALKPDIPVLIFSGCEDLPESVRCLADACVHKTEIRTIVSELSALLDGVQPRPYLHTDRAGIIAGAMMRLRELKNELAALISNPESTETERRALESAIRELTEIIIQNDC